jgi:hypothetical protein
MLQGSPACGRISLVLVVLVEALTRLHSGSSTLPCSYLPAALVAAHTTSAPLGQQPSVRPEKASVVSYSRRVSLGQSNRSRLAFVDAQRRRVIAAIFLPIPRNRPAR